ncbi:SDR family NAD(P)-dependent oxidoreductase [Roseomonas sp. USHLN139]|uniref:SDR family NAD(P)-dependent oxidoreductase n=1 Tax=Roseomonas sp. USHLN139 TaxID=3081298 RepID=UPI003B01881D
MTTPYARRLAALRQGSAPAAPSDDLVAALADILAGSLGVAATAVDPARPFAELGLTSLLAVRFLDRVNRRFEQRLGVDALFAHASVAALAAHLAPRIAPAPAAPVIAAAPPAATPDIAIIGMAGRFPGAPDIATLRDRLAAGDLLVGPMPPARQALGATAGAPAAGYLDDIDCFDAAFFGISPREAAAMDPQQRLFLEQCWLAIEQAGLPAEALRGRRVGVFAGAAASGYEALLDQAAQATQSHGLTGNLVSLLAARIAYALDLRGPALVVDTACSASLVALHLACQAIRSGEVEMALAGGVRLFLDPRGFSHMQRVGMLSAQGRCRSFDAAADGIALGEACAVVLLKPLARALAEGDRIAAVIRGSGTNQDGRSNGITAPNGRAQAELIGAVLAQAGVAPDSLGLVEAHGTGTPLGDPIEVAALAEILGDRARPAWLGSIKSNIGHASEAAGIAGLVKAVLCLQQAEILPSIGFETANPQARFGTALRVATTRQPWPAGETPRRAGVSSFGLSGTNAHVLLQEAPPAPAPADVPGPWLVALSAADAAALDRRAAQLAGWLENEAAPSLGDLCRTLLDGRSALEHRLAFVAPDRAGLLARLRAPAPEDRARLARGATPPAAPAYDAQHRAASLQAAARAWLQGATLDGGALYPGAGRHLPLPAYPFARERHWPAVAAAPLPDAAGTRVFRHDEPLVRDHVVGGAALLHAGLFLEMARQEGAAPALAEIAWLRPATVPAGGSLALRLAREGEALTLLGTTEGRPYARARRASPGAAPAPRDLDALRRTATRQIDPASLPRDAAALHLGPSFPGVARLWLAPGSALGQASLPPGAEGLPPRLSDAAIQTAVALLAAAAEAAGQTPALRYPASLARLEIFAPLPAGEAWILAEPCATDADAVDLLLLDAEGRAFQRWQGLALRPAAVPAQHPAPQAMQPAWITEDALPAAPDWPALLIASPADRALLPGLAAPALAPADAAGIAAAVAGLGPAAPCLWIAALTATDEPVATLALRQLVRALVQAGFEAAPLRLRILTGGAQRVTGTEAGNPAGAALEGLAKAVAAEFPAWQLVILDIDPAAPPPVEALARDPGSPLGEAVALRDGQRWLRQWRPLALPAPRRLDGAWLVVGGMGRVGRAVSTTLAAQGARLTLIGRAPLDAGRQAFLATLPDAQYIAADVADPAAIAAALDAAEARHGPLQGVIQAVVDPVFGRTDRLPEDEFRAGLRPKLAGLAALAAGLQERRGRPELVVFSSIGAFAGFPGIEGQGAYAAACCFEAAFAQTIGTRVIHWGLWADPALNPAMVARLAEAGCFTQDAAASAALLPALLASKAPQIVLAALSPPGWAALGAADATAPAALAALARAAGTGLPATDPALQAAMEAHARASLAEALAPHRPPQGWSEPALRQAFAVPPERAALVAALADILARAEPGPAPAEARSAALRAAATGEAAAALEAALTLLQAGLAALPGILAGTTRAAEVLFPGGSTGLVAPLYRHQPALAACNAMLAATVVALARAKAPARLRILEIGAGTGASTAPALDALAAAGLVADYLCTELSPGLLAPLRATLGERPGLRLAVLDISRPPGPQGIETGAADLVIASDVLHATPEISVSLAHAASLLRPGGLLLLNETTRRDDLATLTFGLLEGWWLARDAARRLPHAPLLDIPGWGTALREAGFAALQAVPAPGEAAETPAHALLLARLARRRALPAPAAAAPSRPAPAAPRATAGLDAIVAQEVGAALELPAARIEADAPFGEIGVDSIVAPQIAEALNARLGIRLRSTDLYNFGSVAALARHIAAAFPEATPAQEIATPVSEEPAAQPDDAIAIIGMAGRFPGAADVDEFWAMLREGRHAVRPLDRFALPAELGARWAALLEDHDRFDPLFFGISPAEAEAMEPQQRLLLEAGWRALEDAGLPPQRLSGQGEGGQACGVFVGVSASNYNAAAAPPALQTLGGSVAILSARLSYLLDLQGPCLPVDTGCSSSLVALHLACESLRRGESRLALAAGVSCNILSPDLFHYLSDAGMASPTGRCHSFDAAADGFVPGEAVACLVLKPLAAALAEGDRIHAVIRGSGINQDGRTSGLTAPSATSQTALETAVYRRAGISPASIGMVEAHGTGTKLGDPIEVAALTDAFRAFDLPPGNFCALGSVKTNIGHTMAAAGMTGVTKAVLALRHRALPPSLNFSAPNPHIDFAGSPFFVNTALRDWDAPAGGGPRRAAVSSFGFSGTNGHVVLEEAPAAAAPTPAAPGGRVLPVSARSAAALSVALDELARALEAAPDLTLADLAHHLACRRGHFRHRRALVADSLDGLPARLRAAAARPAATTVPQDDPVSRIAARWQRGDAAAAGDLAALAALHESGAAIDWTPLADGRRRALDLPGHPFLRERYWGFDPLAGARPAAAAPPQRAADHPLLREHVVQGRPLLPGTAALALLRQAALEARPGRTPLLRDIAWLAPVEADTAFTLQAEPIGEDRLACRLVEAGSGRALARATATFDAPAAAATADLAALAARCAEALDIDTVYAGFAAAGLAYGPGLRLLRAQRRGAAETFATLASPTTAEAHRLPAVLDAALQAAAALGLGATAEGATYVPAGLAGLEVLALPAAGATLHAHAVLRPGQGDPVFDIALLDAAGTPLARLQGLAARRLPATPAETAGTLAWQPGWVAAPALIGSGGDGARLLVSARPALGAALGARLASPDDIATPEDAARLLDAALAEGRPLTLLLDAGAAAPPPASLALALAGSGVETLLRPLFLLARAALRREPVPALRLLVLDRAEGSPAGAAAAAFLRSLAAEDSRLQGRVLRSDEAGAIAAELAAEWQGVEEIRLLGGARQRRQPQPVTLPPAPQPGWVKPGSHWLVTGGLGGIGLILARHLADAGAGRIVLLSRQAPDAAQQTAMRLIGDQVTHVAADLTDAASLRAALAGIRQHGPLQGVAHAAGLLRDARLARQEAADFDAVLAAKAQGAVALDQLTAGDPLDVFLMFSSTAAALGAPGQAAYAAANGFLGGLAEARQAQVAAGRRQGLTQAIDWPLWQGGGMQPPAVVVAELGRQLGLRPMPAAEALRQLDAALAARLPRVTLLHGDTARLAAVLSPVAPAAATTTRDPAETEKWLGALLEEVLQLPPGRLDPEERLEEYGLDSIGIMRLNARLEAELGQVSKTLFFEHRTLRELATRIARDHAPPAPAPAAQALPAAATDGQEIAIIGMAGRYPQARDLEAFWDNLRAGRDCIEEIPAERWPLEGFYDPDRDRVETSYAKWGGFIEGVAEFDARFFGISPVEAESLDPQARKFLETCWAALEDAGRSRTELFRGSADPAARRGGVFVGVMAGDYALFGPEEAARGNLIGPQSAYWGIANRVSWALDLHGPSMAVDSACSASLTAVHAACQAIRAGECELALAGGVNLILHPSRHWILAKSGFAASDGRCRSFGQGGDGYVPGEGVGALLLKPLSAALRDGDRIHAVIRGSALNHGGRSGGFTVPDPAAQGALVAEALARAGTAPETISYIEAHGTGTALGDPVEVAGLARAFAGRAAGSLPIGSVKSAIGHLEAAAGIAGLTKLVLQLRHATLAPSLHAETLNPDLGLAATPLAVQRALAPWPATPGQPRRAGISSFGAGGSNVHLVVEEAPPLSATPPVAGPMLLPLSAATAPALRQRAADLAAWLRRQAAPDLPGLARTLQAGREPLRHRAAAIATTLPEALAALDAIAGGEAPFAGEVRHASDTPADPAAPLARLAADWVAGSATPDWDRLAPGRRPPVSLPTYPFEKRHCWVRLTRPPAPPALPDGVTLAAADAGGNRALRVAATAPILAEHRVQGRALLPGALLLLLGLRALGGTTLAGARFRRPVDQAALDAGLVLAGTPEGITLRDATGEIVAEAQRGGAVAAPGDLAGETGTAIGGEAAYALLESAGAAYRGRFRQLREIRRGEGVAEADLAGSADWTPLLDAAFQLTFALLPEDGAGGPYLPAALAQLSVSGRPETVTRVRGRRRETGPGLVRLDLMLVDAGGTPQALLLGFEARRAGPPPAALPALEAWSAVWDPAPAAAPAALPARPCLLAEGEAAPVVAALAAALGTPLAMAPEPEADAVWLLVGAAADPAAAVEGAVLRLAALLRGLAAQPTPPQLVLVTLGAQAVTPAERPAPLGAALAAFARAAGREWPALRLAVLDLDPASPALAARLPELAIPGADLALREDRPPLRRRFGALDLPAQPAPLCPPGGVVVIAGGAGGLGRALAEHLAEHQGARVALLGRSDASEAVETTLARCAARGGAARHLRADLTDAAALGAALEAIEAEWGPADLVVHAAMDLRDGRIDSQPDAEIAAVLAPKTRGLAALTAALDRRGSRAALLLFSSANAETANPGQAAYAAASAFADAHALGLAEARRVLVADWGFWGEVGRVATPQHRAMMARIGVHPIATAEGLATLGRLWAAPGVTRVMPLRIGLQVAQELGADASRRLPAGGAALLPPAIAAARTRQQAGGSLLQGAAAGFAAINRQAARLALAALRGAGLEDGTAETLAAQLGVPPAQRRLLAAVLDLLQRAGLVTEGRLAAAPGDAELREAAAALVAQDPAAAPYLRLLETCCASLPRILDGTMEANAVLFPGGSMALVAPIYAGNPVVDHLQTLLAEAVAAAVAGRLAAEPGARLRLLEVGAGTGGTTRFLLRALAPFADRVEFLFTDIGPAFLSAAEAEFAATAPFLRTARLDISRSPAAQGIDDQQYDIVVAANVLHATPRLAATLAHVRGLLRPGGLLAVNEATAAQDFNTLTFGLTPGWWLFEDPAERLPHAPLLDPPRWQAVLGRAGFGGTTVLGEAALQCVILAEAQGLPALPAAPPPRAPAPADGALEEKLRQTVAAALRLAPDEVEPDTSFAEYGADSIISVELVRHINEAFGIELKTTALFNYATVRELAGYIRLEHGAALAPEPDATVDADTAERLANARQRTDRLRKLIRRRLDGEAPPPPPAAAAPAPPAALPLEEILRRLGAGEMELEDAMAAKLSDG